MFREFEGQKPTHIGGTYPYPNYTMYPPGQYIVAVSSTSRLSSTVFYYRVIMVMIIIVLQIYIKNSA